nr:tubulin-like doman-containing protein [Ornithinimicrobium sediminis]
MLVGVGGSGGKTLRVVREELLRRLQQAGWKDDLPKAWQFVNVDVPTSADGAESDLPRQLPSRDYTGLVGPGLTYRTLDATLSGGASDVAKDALCTWRPDPNKVNIPVSKGAGQFRAIGRMVTLTGLDKIHVALDDAKRALTGTEVIGELQRLTQLLGGEASPLMADPTVIVISSIAGGSGAGAVIDVCDAIRALGDTWASESLGLMYAPDVFDYLPEEHRKGVRPNSLATLGELLAGYWNSDGPSEDTASLLAMKGVQVGAANRLGPRYPFLVGNRNEYVSYSTQNDIYRAMGRSISAWVASPELQDRITAYLQGNWSSAASSLVDHMPLHVQGTETPFSALGSSRVGLGRDRFRQYASERLARAAVERFLRRHLDTRKEGDDRSDHLLAQESADRVFPRFLAHSGLDERTEAHNDIIDALRPASAVDTSKATEQAIFEQVQKNMGTKGEPAGEVGNRIQRAQRDRRAAYLHTISEGRRENAVRWVEEIQGRVVTQVAQQAASVGGPVTVLLLQRLVVEMEVVADEMRAEAQKYARWANDGMSEVSKALDVDADRLLPDNPVIRKGTRAAAEAMHLHAEAELRELAADLVPDLVSGVLRPLEQSLRFAVRRLEQEELASPSAGEHGISDWPDGDIVPGRLAEAPNEFLLAKTLEYPQILEDLVKRTMGTDQRTTAMDQVVQGILTGEPAAGSEQRFIQRSSSWVPQSQVAAVDSPAIASFEVLASGDHLLRRADTWLVEGGTAMSRYMAENLAGYLSPEGVDPSVHADRLQRFEGALIAALNASAPLVKINPQVLVQVHEEAEPRSSVRFSEIPFAERSPAREVVQKVLQSRGQWSAEVERAFGEGGQSFIDMFATLNRPFEPVVFDSLMQPVAREWGRRNTTSDLIQEFWRWRRARPLAESLPMSPSIRQAMIRGWFTASRLKQLTLADGSATIFQSSARGEGSWLPFPEPLLTGSTIPPQQYLPVVLESILLAMVEVNTSASLRPMAPYTRLRELGKSGSGGVENYDDLNPELRNWILMGQSGAPDPDWEQRKNEVIDSFRKLTVAYEGFFLQKRPDEPLDVPSAYDLRHDIINALHDLIRATESVTAGDDPGVWN